MKYLTLLADILKPLTATIFVAAGVAVTLENYGPAFAHNNWSPVPLALLAIGGNSILLGLKWAVEIVLPYQVHLHRVEVEVKRPTE